jgi:hypothetical protein
MGKNGIESYSRFVGTDNKRLPSNVDSHKLEANKNKLRVLKLQYKESSGDDRSRIRAQLIKLGLTEKEIRML